MGDGPPNEWIYVRHCAAILGMQPHASQRTCAICESNPESNWVAPGKRGLPDKWVPVPNMDGKQTHRDVTARLVLAIL